MPEVRAPGFGRSRAVQGCPSYRGRMTEDRGPTFDGVRIGRPATGALVDAGYRSQADLPEDLEELLALHGVGPRAVRLLDEARRGA